MLRLPIENTLDKKGEIMAEWKNYTLEEVCERIYSGGTPSTKHEEYWNGDIKWLSSGETSQRFVYDTERKITQEGVENSSTKLATKGCTVVATAGQGYTRGQASFLMTDTYMNQSVIACKANENVILPLYLYYNLDSRYEEFRLLSDGTSTRGGLSGWILKRMEIKLPPKSSQKKIIDILYSIDRKIEENNAINNNLEQQVSILYQSWFEDFEITNGVCPEDWSYQELSSIADIASGKRPPVKSNFCNQETPISIVGAASVMGFTSEANHTDKILVTGRVGTHGVVQRFNTPCWTSDNTLVITSPYYEFTNQILHRIDYSSMNRGSTQPLITQGDMKKVVVLVPDENTLAKFEKFAGSLMVKREANNKENVKLASLRDTLLPKLMSGELDVSDIEI